MNIFKKTFSSLNEKDVSPLLNQHISNFRGWGVNGNIELGNNVLLDIEDPTFIIFDINIVDNDESPLFLDTNTSLNSVRNFLGRYMEQDPEINTSAQIYPEFLKICKLIFPFSGNSNKTKSGSKRHYINSVSGLGILNKKIINYPEDKIIINISEDVSMLSQYLVELYQNMTYSFASQRQLIPNNLLKFDMYLILSDIRDMKFGKNKNIYRNNYIDNIIENKSKYIYVLHDCEFNFLNSKIHGDDITVAGFGTTPTNTPATLSVDIIFKSYSRILIPALMLNTSVNNNEKNPYGALILDNKMTDIGFTKPTNGDNLTIKRLKYTPERGPIFNNINIPNPPVFSHHSIYDMLNDSYVSQKDYYNKSNKKTYNISGIDEPNSVKFSNDPEKNNNTYLNKLSKTTKNKVKEFGSALKNKAHNEANKLKDNLQKGISDAIGVNMTIERINVYYETPEQKIDRLSSMANTLVNKTANAMQKTISDTVSNVGKTIKGKEANYGAALNNFGTIINNDVMNQAIGTLTGKKVITSLTDLNSDNGNIYGLNINSTTSRSGYTIDGKDDLDDNQFNDKKPSDKQKLKNSNIEKENIYTKNNETYMVLNGGDETDLHKDATYNQKYPEGDLSEDGTYNNKFPNGNVSSKGKYNKKYPKGDVHDNGSHNEKYPEGDLHDGTTYNEKYPEGDLHDDGLYNKKYPDGDIHEDGNYNKKYPNGEVHEDGSYNEKNPNGDVHEDGIYNKKYPDGDLHDEGLYNQKFPIGDVHEDSNYNKKYPNGDVHEDGNYNKKYPNGEVHEDGRYNEKYPNGDVHIDASYNLKFPEGDVHEDGNYNIKYPDGDVHEDGKYNIKIPDGDVHENSTYNKKYPKGEVHQDGEYNVKFPDGSVHTDGQYNMKFPDGDVQTDGKYNKKYPIGNRQQKGDYNKKYPEGDLMEDGQYNIKFPEGDVQEDASYNEKYPSGIISEKGKYNKKYPNGDVHKDSSYHTKEPNQNNIYLDKNNKYNK